MAQKSYFFNSAPGDRRTYQAADFARYFGSVLTSGIMPNPETGDIAALTPGEYGLNTRMYANLVLGLQVVMGNAIIRGYRYELDSPHDIAFRPQSSGDVGYDRIDRIVLRLDLSNHKRSIELAVVEGNTAINPVPPALTRNYNVYELSLARVRVRAGYSYIDESDVVDERADETVCGFANSLITVPTSVFQQQFDAWFENYQTSAGEEFDEWFANLGEILNENAAGNLLREIQAVDSKKADKSEINARLNQIEQQMQQRVTYTYFDAYMGSVVDWSPQGVFTTFAALVAQYPNGADGFMLVQENGHAYKWISGAWEDVGMYQSGAGDFVNALTEDGQEWIV